jgi:tRNA modification GTPase
VAHQPHPGKRGEGESRSPLSGGDTIAAIATPPGRGGIGVVRVSGSGVRSMAAQLLGGLPSPRLARLADFTDASGTAIDRGLALFFPAPGSYTGEDVLELQGHGGPLVMQMLLRRCVELGARIAQPGEFTRRAFLNERLDLAQAESVADLIDASSVEAARSAARSLTGEFSRHIHALVAGLVDLRVHVEACIDFPEEEIDPADIASQAHKLAALRAQLEAIMLRAAQGAVLREGLTVVIIGRPNVGKSSLLNRMAGDEIAIVTAVAGTTRDYVRATVSVQGVPIHLVDTAGLREAEDEVERLGVERSWRAVDSAGAVLFVSDSEGDARLDADLIARVPAAIPVARVLNKVDLTGQAPGRATSPVGPVLAVSAATGAGMEMLENWLLETAGWRPHGEGLFMARERHIDALRTAATFLADASTQQAFEFKAEDLRLAQTELARITGEVSADDVLGAIFSSFCIGK